MSGESKNGSAAAGSGAGSGAAANNKNKTYRYLGDLTLEEGEAIFTKGRRFTGLSTPEEPIFVLLIGTPGSGKSTALARLPELVGLNPDDAVQISLDSLVESLEPFRAKTAEIATAMLTERGLALQNNLGENVVSNIASKTSGPYLSFMKAKKNNRPGKVGKPLEQSLNEMRFALLEKALSEGKNIIYERTISDASKDTLREEVFARIRASGKPYKVYVVYTKIDDPAVLRERLRRRPLGMMQRNPPFFRGVPATLAEKFIGNHEEYFRRFLLPLEGEGVQLVVVYWDGRPDLFIPARPAKAEGENASTSNKAGGRRKTRRQSKKKRMTRRK